jgi:hypothetical protein
MTEHYSCQKKSKTDFLPLGIIAVLVAVALLSPGCSTVRAQEHGFKFGEITYKDLNMKVYEPDTSASAVVLNEFGEGHVDNDEEIRVVFDYHVRIKILKQRGVDDLANVIILMRKQEGRAEEVSSIKASSFNLENSAI